MNRVAISIGSGIARRSGKAADLLRRFATQVADSACNSNNFNAQTNGEAWLLDRISRASPEGHVFDVGANIGDWTRLVCGALADSTVHAFEPASSTYKDLTSTGSRLGPRVVTNNFGLSDVVGIATFYEYDASDLGNAYGWHAERPHQKSEVVMSTGLTYCQERGLNRILLLKIDVEGGELAVLRGFGDMLADGSIAIIQFEYGAFATAQRILLKDYFELLGQGYRIGRLLPRSVQFSPYTETLEGPKFANYVAVHQGAPSLVRDYLA